MNNNFSFNYNKNFDNKDKVEVEKLDDNLNQDSYKYFRIYENNYQMPIESENNDNFNNGISKARRKRIILFLTIGLVGFLVLFIVSLMNLKYNVNINDSNIDDNNDINNNDVIDNNPTNNNTNNNDLISLNIKQLEYTIDYAINDIKYLLKYKIIKDNNNIYITKTDLENTNYYLAYNDNYYSGGENNYKLVLEKEIFDVIPYNYLDISTINNYLRKATLVENDNSKNYYLLINEITLLDNNDAISISILENSYKIDYTNLFKLLTNYDYLKVTLTIIS